MFIQRRLLSNIWDETQGHFSVKSTGTSDLNASEILWKIEWRALVNFNENLVVPAEIWQHLNDHMPFFLSTPVSGHAPITSGTICCYHLSTFDYLLFLCLHVFGDRLLIVCLRFVAALSGTDSGRGTGRPGPKCPRRPSGRPKPLCSATPSG